MSQLYSAEQLAELVKEMLTHGPEDQKQELRNALYGVLLSTGNQTKTVLEMMKKPLHDFSSGGVDLWHIITGLRGPDSPVFGRQAEAVKKATTEVLRHALFGACFCMAYSSPDHESKVALRKELWEGHCCGNGHHFVEHARAAFSAAGLDWDKVNK